MYVPGNACLSPPGALVVEEDSVAGVHAVGLTEVHAGPEGVPREEIILILFNSPHLFPEIYILLFSVVAVQVSRRSLTQS